ncbi:MAG: hypothetical protein ACLFVU_06720 [Phycisphaerae bacterium]
MKKLLMGFVLALVGLSAGCSGMVDTPAERERRFSQINELNQRMIVDDWDYLWLQDRNSRLNEWHVHVGPH